MLSSSNIKVIGKLNSLFGSIISKVNLNGLTNDVDNTGEMDSLQRDLDAALNYETNLLSKYTGDNDMSMMLNKLLLKGNNTPATFNKPLSELMEDDVNQFGLYFYDRYRNINNQYEDLRVIVDYLSEMEEVINTIRDNLVCADDIGVNVSRTLNFTNGGNDDSAKTNIAEVERIERTYNLKNLLKNVIYRSTLIYGMYYVYTIPYAKLFAMHKTKVQNDPRYNIGESVVKLSLNNKDKGDCALCESVTKMMKDIDSTYKESSVMSDISKILENIEVVNDGSIPLLEDLTPATMSDENFKNVIQRSMNIKKNNPIYPETIKRTPQNREVSSDAVIDPQFEKEFKDISGVYMKTYLPTKVIPAKILDFTIGYYILYETYSEVQNNMLVNGSLNRMNLIYQATKYKDLDNSIVHIIAEKIVQSIDKKFVQDNVKFKEMIANAISYDNFYRKAFRVQFVPPEYITEFKVNEDPETKMGESVIKKSLFYAKLYLLILMFKIITIVTKSNDQRVYYIKNSGINKNMVARVQQAARTMKRNQISFNDLGSVDRMLYKVGKNPDMYMPVGVNGEKSIDFDILSGQDVQLDNDFIQFLRKSMINNSGVPSVILTFMDEADYAKTLTMMNSKYLTRIISFQEELEVQTTELYKKLLSYETSINEMTIQSFQYKLTRPKALNIQNMSDLISNAENAADFIVRVLVGDDTEDATKNRIKSIILRNVLVNGIFDWDSFDEYVNLAMMQLKKENMVKNAVGDGSGGEA